MLMTGKIIVLHELTPWRVECHTAELCNQFSARITPSNATSAIAFAGKARKKQGTKPRQYPVHPVSRYIDFAASFQRGYFLSGPKGSVMMRCFTTSEG